MEDLISVLLHSVNQVHTFHLQTKSFAEHKALNEYYDSVGDWHSTRKLSEVEKTEDARHGGHGRECGLHLDVPEGTDFTV